MRILPILAGSTIGFSTWLINIMTMEGVMHRQNQDGEDELTPQNIIEYLKYPFDREKTSIAWGLAKGISIRDRLKLLSMNWVAVTSLGAVIALLISKQI